MFIDCVVLLVFCGVVFNYGFDCGECFLCMVVWVVIFFDSYQVDGDCYLIGFDFMDIVVRCCL